MEMAEPEIVFDGTVLRVSVAFTPLSEEIALVDLWLTDPALHEEPEAQEALATGAELMGVHAVAALYAGDTQITAERVFFEEQDGRATTKGFIFVLRPDTPREDLMVQIDASLMEMMDGPVLEHTQVRVPVPEAMAVETVTIPADIQLEEVLPNYPNVMMAEEDIPPDWSRLTEVRISRSAEAYCACRCTLTGTRSIRRSLRTP